MKIDRRLLWVVLPYLAVFLGMSLRSGWAALLGFHAALLIVLLRPGARAQAPRLLVPVSMRVILPLALLGVLGGLGLWIIWPLPGLDRVYIPTVTGLGLSGPGWLPFIAYFTLVNPWLEEWFWRGLLLDEARGLSPVDFLFAGYHLFILALFVSLPWMAFAFTVLTLTGWLWRRVALRTGSLLPAVISHMLADLSILLVLFIKAGTG